MSERIPVASRLASASSWSVAGGVGAIALNAAAVPVLYFLLPKQEFAEWVTAFAYLNLWCFPEGAQNLLVASGARDTGADGNRLSLRLRAVSLAAAFVTLCAECYWWSRDGDAHAVMHRLAPQMILCLAIPVRFHLASLRGQLQAAGLWSLHAKLVTLLSFFSSGGVIVAAWLSRDIAVIATSHVVILCIQAVAFGRLKKGLDDPRPGFHIQRNAPSLLTALAFSLGPLIFTQGDRLVLRACLPSDLLSDYAFYTSIASQISVVAALPCIPLATLGSKDLAEHARMVRFAINMNVLAVIGAVAVVAGVCLISDWRQVDVFGSRSPYVLLGVACIYGGFSLNSPAYFALVGHQRYRLAAATTMGASLFSVILIYLLGARFGLLGAIAGNIAYGVTVLLSFPAKKIVQGRGWDVILVLGFLLSGLGAFILINTRSV